MLLAVGVMASMASRLWWSSDVRTSPAGLTAPEDVPAVHRQADAGRVHLDVGHRAGGQDDDVVAAAVEFTGFDVVIEPEVDAEAFCIRRGASR